MRDLIKTWTKVRISGCIGFKKREPPPTFFRFAHEK